MGTFKTFLPNDLALSVAQKLIQCGVERNFIAPNYTLRGHRDVKPETDCPGMVVF
jgi:hypothetical protein